MMGNRMMEIESPPRRMGIVLLAAILAAAPAAAQSALEARMRAFTHAVSEGRIDSVAAFFPRRGTWTWVLTTHEGTFREHVGAWRFDAGQTLRVIDGRGPACEAFATHGEIGVRGPLTDQVMQHSRPWRRVRGNRFVPRGASVRSPAFVQWRREDGAWVVSAFGDERWMQPRLLGFERYEGRRDSVPGAPLTLPIPPDAPTAGLTRWYLGHQPILFEGFRYFQYGPSRTLAPGDVTRIASLDGVGLYAETGQAGLVDMLYVPVRPGFEFQPYQGFGAFPCYDPHAPGAGR
jgi:hypothetical protein